MKLRRRTALLVIACAILCVPEAVLAQFTQQGPKLVGSGAVGKAEQGISVAISGDGNTAIVGGILDDIQIGAAWVWTRSGGVWTQQGPKLLASDAPRNITFVGAEQGYSVALSADGNTAIVGGPQDGAHGAAWIWTRSGGVWTQQGLKLVGSGAVGDASQGWSVALSADGNTAIVGGDTDNDDHGAAWVWTRSGGVWTQQGAKLVGSGAVSRFGFEDQGSSVSLSADGNTALIGGSNDNDGVGAAWVWTRSGGVWTQQGGKLVGSGVGQSNEGISVSLAADGNTAIIGGTLDPSQNSGFTGAAWVWVRSGGVWNQVGKLVGAGNAVSLSADGQSAAVGGASGGVGGTWVWTRSGSAWVQSAKLVGTGAVDPANQGRSVSISADGKTVITGGNDDDYVTGAAWVFAATADLSVTKSVTGGPSFAAGGNLNYSIHVVNNGPGSASSVVMTDVVPSGSTFVSATSSQGSCSGTTTVICTLGTLANGGGATISLVLKVPSAPGTVSNTASVTALELDPDPTNNSSTATVKTIDPNLIPVASSWVIVALAGMLALVGTMKMRG